MVATRDDCRDGHLRRDTNALPKPDASAASHPKHGRREPESMRCYIFSHLEIDLKGELMEKMGQPIRSRNLKKSEFSLVGNEDAVVKEEEPPTPERRIEDIESESIVPIGETTVDVIPPIVPAPAIIEESVVEGVAHTEGEHEDIQIEETPSVPKMEISMKESHEDSTPEVVAPGHIEDGEPATTAPVDQFQESLVESTSDEDVEPNVSSGGKGKCVASGIPLLTRKAHHRSRKKKIHVHLEPVIARLNAQGEILCSLQSDVTSIFLSQSTEAKDIGAVKSELHGMRSELGSLKKLVTDLSDFVRVHLSAPTPPAPTQSVPETPAPSSPPTSFTAPPAPEPSKKSLPKHISSPTPFPTASSSSPIPSSSIPHTTSEAPPASSSSAGPSSACPSSAGPSTQPPPTSSLASFHPPTPPSFITIIPEGASIIQHTVYDIKDEFEEVIVRTVLVVSAHIYRTDSQPSSSPVSKKRKTSKELMLEIAFLPKLHFLLMDSEVGLIIFERFSRVMARIFVQRGAPLAFHRFPFREYQRGFIKSSVLAPLLSESKRLVNTDWCKAYPEAAIQLENLNSSLTSPIS
ncbi:hypothetical protein Taro_054491 [Colocasia esculenta]|uniref:Uncharacterized protein n=1 Tax=Colocasia esculenta TaxID=4460 RepID=A0A843XQR1_COLES|nr:hypothetical protein [Colocasia esculenta]